MTIEPLPVIEIEEQLRRDGLAVAAAAAAVCGPEAIRSLRPVPGRGHGAWIREGRAAIQSSHGVAAPSIGPARERRNSTRMKLWIQVEGRPYEVEVDTAPPGIASNGRSAPKFPIPEAVLRPRPPQKLPEDSTCRTPIAGRVVAILAGPGTAVQHNQPVVLLEAMKMEVPIGPAVDGVIKSIHVETGQTVSAKQVLFEIE
jgi:methylmalonyl-CoA carboxyltransferase small subunit